MFIHMGFFGFTKSAGKRRSLQFPPLASIAPWILGEQIRIYRMVFM